MKRFFILLIMTLISTGMSNVFGSLGCDSSTADHRISRKEKVKVAYEVLERVLGNKAKTIKLELKEEDNLTDSYEYEVRNSKLVVRGSSVVALTRGVYDYLKSQHIGMLDWTGPQFNIPAAWPATSTVKNETPYRIRHAYNAVTPGYTTPYWDWKRWEQELDWQAMHGFNMLMAPVATEAIATRVWKRLGLTQQEIDEFYVGPAHLPWQRMGNICQVGGNLPEEWHKDQIALQHKLLKRMRKFGIEPVIQSFAGFVPKALKRIYPDIVLHNTLWNAGFSPEHRPVLLMPGDPLFAKITKLYMEEWQKEFGKQDYFLVDSFNELELPKTDRPVTDLLAEYGEKTFRAIKSGNADAMWVIQGWMFGYQRHIWSPERVEALFSKVPNDSVLILDYANDYANNWEPMNAFNGKQWAYGFVPNMGGKTAYTGSMELYATGAGKTWNSPKKKNLVGFTISGEGLENNTVLYELMTDVAWNDQPIDLDNWLNDYCLNRYGMYSENMKEAWQLFRESCYKRLEPHPQFGWQLGTCRLGSVSKDPKFHEGVVKFLNAVKTNETAGYRDDAIEMAALSLGLKADEWFVLASEAYQAGDVQTGDRAGERGLELLTELDRLMESHPLHRLDRWLDFTKLHDGDQQLKDFYAENARQIVTVWGPPVNDYSCRVWSGLVRDFYRERMRNVLKSLKTGEQFESVKWQVNWVKHPNLSKVDTYKDPVAEAKRLVEKALGEELPVINIHKGESIGNWNPGSVRSEWKEIEWNISVDQLKKLGGVKFVYVRGNHRLDIKKVSLIADGKEVAKDEHFGFAGKPNQNNRYMLSVPENVTGNNGCTLRTVVKSNGGTDSYGRLELIEK
ncbi:alpha-N-acetylglucosaminidase [Puteibacter caeruleilacunae]|nr:alpha-N-acetylglucosaminidase [Puteibacter caeruleilacunae]